MIQLFKEQLESVLNPMMQLLDSNLGSRCELIVCEVTAERNLKIIMSRNASVEHEVGFIFNGLDMNLLEENHGFLTGGTVSVGGKFIKSTTAAIYEDGQIVGTVTTNLDVTDIVFVQNQLQDLSGYAAPSGDKECSDVNELMDLIISKASKMIGKPAMYMNKNDKKEFIRYLDERGFFQIKKSTDKVAKFLDISMFTLYSNLEDIRSSQTQED
ncbi:helix-turn-helix domain-containing protein [Clostridium sp. AN503]|uniref:helix-turn-helix domain-containing protein n=1 Tax=Clostridium sp. AN503 TaxID=3160598 RepID=UPI003458D6BF